MTSQETKKNFTANHIFYGYIIVTLAFFINFTAFGSNAAFGVFFNPMLTELGWTRALTSGAFSVSWLIQGALGIFRGRLKEKGDSASKPAFTLSSVIASRKVVSVILTGFFVIILFSCSNYIVYLCAFIVMDFRAA